MIAPEGRSTVGPPLSTQCPDYCAINEGYQDAFIVHNCAYSLLPHDFCSHFSLFILVLSSTSCPVTFFANNLCGIHTIKTMKFDNGSSRFKLGNPRTLHHESSDRCFLPNRDEAIPENPSLAAPTPTQRLPRLCCAYGSLVLEGTNAMLMKIDFKKSAGAITTLRTTRRSDSSYGLRNIDHIRLLYQLLSD